MSKVLVLGGGFAAVAAIEELHRRLGDRHEITLVSSNHNFTFYPALVPFVFGGMERDEICFDLGPKLADLKVSLVEGVVDSFDPQRRAVQVTTSGKTLSVPYDHLLIALGRTLDRHFVPGALEFAHNILNLPAAERFKNALATFDEGAIAVGMCPGSTMPIPVCESALALAKRFAKEISAKKISVSVFFPETLDAAFAGSALFRDIEGSFERGGVRLITDFRVERVEAAHAISDRGEVLPFDLMMLLPKFHGQPALTGPAWQTDRDGFLKVNERMQVCGSEEIYAAGDIIAVEGPRFGYMAIEQGKVAARNIAFQVNGETADAVYQHKLAWAIGERYTDPVYFHYGFWDESLDEFDESAFFGMARSLRQRYGSIKGYGTAI